MRQDTPNTGASRPNTQLRLHRGHSWSGLCTRDSRTRCWPMSLNHLLQMYQPPRPLKHRPHLLHLLLLFLLLHHLLRLLHPLLLLPLLLLLLSRKKKLRQSLHRLLIAVLLCTRPTPPTRVNHPHQGKFTLRYSMKSSVQRSLSCQTLSLFVFQGDASRT